MTRLLCVALLCGGCGNNALSEELVNSAACRIRLGVAFTRLDTVRVLESDLSPGFRLYHSTCAYWLAKDSLEARADSLRSAPRGTP